MGDVGSVNNSTRPKARSRRDGWVYTTLLLLLGCTGAHRFYLGKIGMGIAYLFTFGFFGIGILVDAIVLVSNSVRDGEYVTVQVDKGARVFITLVVLAVIFFSLLGFVVIGATKAAVEHWVTGEVSESDIRSLRIEITTKDGETIQTIIGDAVRVDEK